MPNTKSQSKFLGPFTASKITDSHAIISKEELKSKKDKKVPIHITQLYHERQDNSGKITLGKRKSVAKIDSDEVKRSKSSHVCSIFE